MGIQTSSSSSSILDPCLHIHRSDNSEASSNSDHHHYADHLEGYDDGVVFRQHHDYDDTGDINSGDHSYRVLRGSSSCKGDTTLFAFDYR